MTAITKPAVRPPWAQNQVNIAPNWMDPDRVAVQRERSRYTELD